MSNQIETSQFQPIKTTLRHNGDLRDDLKPHSDDSVFSEGYCTLYFDPDHPVIREHKLSNVGITIEHDVLVQACFGGRGFCSQRPRFFNRGETKVIVTVIKNPGTTKVRIAVEIANSVPRNPRRNWKPRNRPEDVANYFADIKEITHYLDSKQVCWPLATEAYLTMFGALNNGNAMVIGVTQRGLQNRLMQLDVLARIEDAALRNRIAEMIEIMDTCIEAALRSQNKKEALAIGLSFEAGEWKFTGDAVSAMAKETLDRQMAEEDQGQRKVDSFAQVAEEKKRRDHAREERDAKRNLPTVASLKPAIVKTQAPVPTEPDESTETGEDEETDGDQVEGTPETASTQAPSPDPQPQTAAAPVATKPKETKKDAVKQDKPLGTMQAQLAAKIASRKLAAQASAETAPTAESAKTE